MPKSRPPCPPEFRQRIIELLRKGRTPESLAEQFETTAQTIRNWLAQADRDAGQRLDGLPSDEREELRRLRRENKTLREEREFLAHRLLDVVGGDRSKRIEEQVLDHGVQRRRPDGAVGAVVPSVT